MTLKFRYRCYSHNTPTCATPIACWYKALVSAFAWWLLSTIRTERRP